MRLTVTENITLDGVIDATEGWFAPSGDEADVDNSDIEAVVQEHMAEQEALLLGRRTFEEMRGYWPHQTGDTTGISDHLNRVQKYVVSSTLTDPEWENTTVLRGIDEVRALEGNVGLTGSIALAHQLIEAGLVDGYRLFVYPVVLGRGFRLFEATTGVGELQRVDCRPFRSGVVLMSYRRRER